MKKLSDIVGLRIVTISDGLEVGIVRSVIINSAKARIEYFATEKGISLLKAKIADARCIEGIGDYALTIKTKDSVWDINSVPEALELVHAGVEVIGNRVISRKGKLLGEAVDLIIDDEDNCKVSSVQIISNNIEPKVYNVPASSVVTYGQNFLVIKYESESEFTDKGSEFTDKVSDKASAKGSEIISSLKTEPSENSTASQMPITRADEILAVSRNAKLIKNVSDLLDYKQKQFANGKLCTKKVVSKDGRIIVDEGQFIDDEVYYLAKTNGKILELLKNLAR